MESKGRREGEVGDESLGLGRDSWLKAEDGWGGGASCKDEWRNGISQGREDKESAQRGGKFLSLTKISVRKPTARGQPPFQVVSSL